MDTKTVSAIVRLVSSAVTVTLVSLKISREPLFQPVVPMLIPSNSGKERRDGR
jgi:hypothetical protein